MRRPPFDRLPELDGVFDTEQYSLLLDHLGKSTVQSDCLVAICGADGCGKTTLLNRFLFSLADDVCVARLDESYKGVKDFYCEILRQLGFHDIDGKPEELRRITREFIVNRGMASEPVLLVIDNAHLISPFILEQLRWLSAIKVDEVRVLSCVLAGNSDLMRIMDSSAMSQFAFNHYIRFHIRAYTEAETIDYVWSRLRYAGCSDRLTIAEAARPLIHRFSGGIPRLINILCDAVLQEACSLESTEITDEMLRDVAEHRHLVPHVLPYSGIGRRRSDPDFDASRAANEDADAMPAPDGDDDAARDGEGPRDVAHVDKDNLWAAGETSGLRQQVSRLSKKLADLKSENSRFLTELDSRDDDIRKLEEALQSQVLRYAKLEEAFGDKSGAYEQLSESMLDRVRALERSEETNRHLVETLREDQQELAELREKLAAAAADKGAITGLQRESVELRRQLANADRDKKTIARLEREIADLQEKLELAAADKETIAGLEREIADLQETLELAAADKETIAGLESKITDLQKKLELAEADKETIAGLESEIADLQEKLELGAADKETIAGLERATAELQEKLELAAADQDTIANLERESRELREQLDDARAEIDTIPPLKLESAELRDKLAEAAGDKETIASLRLELDGLHEKLADAAEDQQALTDVQGELQELQEKQSAGAERIAELQSELSDALEALGHFERELDAAHREAGNLQERADARQAEVKQQSALVADMEAAVKAHDQEVAALQARIDELEGEQLAVAERLSQFASLEAYANDCDARLDALQLQLEKARKRAAADADDTGVVAAVGSGDEPAGETESAGEESPGRAPIRTIEVFRNDSLEQVVRISEDQNRVMIGRDADNDLVLDSNFISRHHAILSLREDGSACIEDLNSLNGVLVNKSRRSSADLNVGDVVILGDFCLLPGPA